MWFSAQGMVDRANLTNYVVEEYESRQRNAGIFARSILPGGARTATEVADALAARLRVMLDEEDRADLVEYLNTRRNTDGTVVASPFDPDDAGQVEARVRGALYILAQHPTYHLR